MFECTRDGACRLLGLFGWTGQGEIIIIILAVLLLFGGKKLPELARGLARSLRIFKDELKGVKNDVEEAGEERVEEAGEERKEGQDSPPFDGELTAEPSEAESHGQGQARQKDQD